MKSKTMQGIFGSLVFAFAACVLGGYQISGISAAVAIILLAGVALDPLYAVLVPALYLIAGIWLPVYPGLSRGVGVLFGASGGFLLSLLLCALIVAAMRKGMRGYPFLATFVGLCAAFLLFFGIGILWTVVRTGASFSGVLYEQAGMRCILFGFDALLALLASPTLYRVV